MTGCNNDVEKKKIHDISSEAALALIKSRKIFILDVRTPAEFAAGHIKDSVLIPLQVLNIDYTKITAHKNEPLLVYCRSGNRSTKALKILSDKGFKKLYHIEKGINAWIEKGFPLEKNP